MLILRSVEATVHLGITNPRSELLVKGFAAQINAQREAAPRDQIRRGSRLRDRVRGCFSRSSGRSAIRRGRKFKQSCIPTAIEGGRLSCRRVILFFVRGSTILV